MASIRDGELEVIDLTLEQGNDDIIDRAMKQFIRQNRYVLLVA